MFYCVLANRNKNHFLCKEHFNKNILRNLSSFLKKKKTNQKTEKGKWKMLMSNELCLYFL